MERWAGPESQALVGEGGVVPLQLGLPGSALPASAPAHPFLFLVITVVRVAAAGADVFLSFFLLLLLLLSVIFPTPRRFMFLGVGDRRETTLELTVLLLLSKHFRPLGIPSP